MRLLFIGNSITQHEISHSIGWHVRCGMAASCPENDYVHVLCHMVGDAEYMALNIASLEREPESADIDALLCDARRFDADTVIIRLSENVPDGKISTFIAAYEKAAVYLDGFGKTICCVGSFWKNDTADALMRGVAEKNGYKFVSLANIQTDEYMAIGQYENKSVARHPSDKGMRAIAEHIFAAMQSEDESDGIEVFGGGKRCRVHRCRISAFPLNREYPGRQRDKGQSVISHFVNIPTGKITIDLGKSAADARILPSCRAPDVVCEGTRMTFTADDDYYVIENGKEHLHLFPVSDCEPDIAPTYAFTAGEYEIGKTELHPGDSVYIARGATVYGSFRACDADGIRIYGGGILDGSREERGADIGWTVDGLFNFLRCKNITIDGITLRDPCWWTLIMFNCTDAVLRNVKVIGNWRYNSDGFDFCNCDHIEVDKCFLRTFDDTLVYKGLRIDGLDERDVCYCTARNCTLMCDWDGAIELGAETIADEYHDLSFENIDIIRTSDGALRIHNGDRAVIHDISYKNIRIEYTPADTEQVYQHTDDTAYPNKPRRIFPPAVKGWTYCNRWSPDGIMGKIRDITYDGIHIFCRDDCIDELKNAVLIWMEGRDGDRNVPGITVRDFTLNGEPFMPRIHINSRVEMTVNGERIKP